MDFAAISDVRFGDKDSLAEFLFANGVQHKTYRETFFLQGITVPAYPLIDAEIDNLDDWLLAHQVEHQQFAALLGLENPFNMLDTDWNDEQSFYDWLATHLTIHEQITAGLGLS